MNLSNLIEDIEKEKKKAKKYQKAGEADGNSEFPFWQGYIEALDFCKKLIIHKIEKRKSKNGK